MREMARLELETLQTRLDAADSENTDAVASCCQMTSRLDINLSR